MKILLNEKPHSIGDETTISSLMEQIKTPKDGVAVAVNDSVVPRSNWDDYILKVEDKVLIIKAAQGG